MTNVIAYIRVSTDGQVGDDKYGLEAQREQIEEYCRRNDYQIQEWVADEGESGAKERPGFDRIIYGEVSNPPVEAVIVAKSDRVARDINVYYYYKMMLNKKEIKLISITEDFGAFGAFSSMLEAFTLCVAQMERENITKRTTGGRQVKASKGGYSGGRAPFGYKIADGELVINEEEAAQVRRAFELRAAGGTYIGIADQLSEEGYVSRSGGKISFSTIQNVLNNKPTYMGYYHYGDSPDWIKGRHQPLIPDDGTCDQYRPLTEKRRNKMKAENSAK